MYYYTHLSSIAADAAIEDYATTTTTITTRKMGSRLAATYFLLLLLLPRTLTHTNTQIRYIGNDRLSDQEHPLVISCNLEHSDDNDGVKQLANGRGWF